MNRKLAKLAFFLAVVVFGLYAINRLMNCLSSLPSAADIVP